MDKILVVVGYTDYKYYARPLFPRIFNDLTYKNKDIFFVTDDNFPGLSNADSGDIICANVRALGVEAAVKRGFDWVFFLDIDAIPDEDILEKLLSVRYPFVGGAIAWRGDSTKLIGHTYSNDKKLDRYPLNLPDIGQTYGVDGISGALMLVHRSIFTKCDYKGYEGVYTIPYRTTCDDEFYCLQVYEKTGIKPKINTGAKAWHLDKDGFAYKWYGEKKKFKAERGIITFKGKIYDPKIK